MLRVASTCATRTSSTNAGPRWCSPCRSAVRGSSATGMRTPCRSRPATSCGCNAFPQHGPGRKHERAIALEDWQQADRRPLPRRVRARPDPLRRLPHDEPLPARSSRADASPSTRTRATSSRTSPRTSAACSVPRAMPSTCAGRCPILATCRSRIARASRDWTRSDAPRTEPGRRGRPLVSRVAWTARRRTARVARLRGRAPVRSRSSRRQPSGAAIKLEARHAASSGRRSGSPTRRRRSSTTSACATSASATRGARSPWDALRHARPARRPRRLGRRRGPDGRRAAHHARALAQDDRPHVHAADRPRSTCASSCACASAIRP